MMLFPKKLAWILGRQNLCVLNIEGLIKKETKKLRPKACKIINQAVNQVREPHAQRSEVGKHVEF